MADKKITALTDLGSGLASEDLFHVIDDPSGTPINKKVSAANVFNNIPTWIGLDGTPQSLSSAGVVNVTTSITQLTTSTANYAVSLADGNTGQIKIITMVADGGFDVTLTPANFANGTTITFEDAGDTVTLIFTNSNWVVLSNYGCTIA